MRFKVIGYYNGSSTPTRSGKQFSSLEDIYLFKKANGIDGIKYVDSSKIYFSEFYNDLWLKLSKQLGRRVNQYEKRLHELIPGEYECELFKQTEFNHTKDIKLRYGELINIVY